MGDFERTFGAGADAASIIDRYSRGLSNKYAPRTSSNNQNKDVSDTLVNNYNWCLRKHSLIENHGEVVIPGMLDVTVQVQMALSAVLRAPKPRVEYYTLINTLIGKLSDDVIKNGMNKIKTFGAGRDVPEHAWKLIIFEMVKEKLFKGSPWLSSTTVFRDLKIGDAENWRDFLRGTNRLVMNVETIRAQERADAARVLNSRLTERDPNGKSQDARRDRPRIYSDAVSTADYWLAVLNGEKSLVAEYLTLSPGSS